MMESATPQVNPGQRLFLALWPNDAVRQQLSVHAQHWTWPTGCVRYLSADWHVTLHYIGKVATDQIPDLAAHVDMAVQPFELRLDQPELWPHGLAVLVASEVPAPLHALRQRLGEAVAGLGLPVEARPFRPHVTLARRAKDAIAPLMSAPVRWRANCYGLVESTGSSDGRYRIIRQYG